MAHFAQIENGIVTQVIVAEADYIDTKPGMWVKCSYNTRGGVHLTGGEPLRKNYPGPGWTYDAIRDAFIPPQPADIDGYGPYILNEDTCLWAAPAGYVPPLPGTP